MWNLLRWAGLLLLVLRMPAFSLQPVAASQPQQDYWFSEKITLDNTELPIGLEIRFIDSARQPRALLIFNNYTNSMLYVMSLTYKDVLVMATPDPAWNSRLKGAQEAASFIIVPKHTTCFDMTELTDLDKNLVDRNVLSADPPPENVAIPAAQASELLLVHDGQVIEVPFTLTYSLNTHFGNSLPASTPTRVQAAPIGISPPHATVLSEWKSRNGFLIAGLVGLDLIVVSAWFIWKVLRRNR